MPAIARFETLEELRPLIFLLSKKLESQFIGAHFPLEKTTYECTHNYIEFHRELAHGYELVCLDRSFADPIHFNDLLRARTLHRALQSFTLVLVQQGLLYQTRSFDSWSKVYAIYSRAEQYGIEKVRVKDGETGTESNVGDVFKSILLFALSETAQYQHHDILRIYKFFSQFSRYVVIRTAGCKADENIASHYFKLDSGEPPGRLVDGKTVGDNRVYRYLSIQPMIQLIGEHLLSSTASNKTLASNALPEAAILSRVVHRIESLKKRNFTRLPETAEYKLVFGLDHLIAVFTNQIKVGVQPEKPNATFEFDDVNDGDRSNRDLPVAMNESPIRVNEKDVSNENANHKASQLENFVHVYKGSNTSATGYCLTYSENSSAKIKVGDLVGIYEKESEINTGLICWLEYPNDGVLSFGIKLLSPKAKAVGIGVLKFEDIENTETPLSQFVDANALFLPAIPATKKPISLLTLPLIYEVGNWIVVKIKNQNKIYRLKSLLDSSSAVSHFELIEFNGKSH